MRYPCSLWLLFIVFLYPTALAQDVDVPEVADVPDAGTAAGEEAADVGFDEPAERPAIIQIDVWTVTLLAEADERISQMACSPLADRDSVIERIKKLQKEGVVERLHHFMATTLDEQQLIVQAGERKPRVQAVNVTQFGTQRNLVYEPVGTMLQARPRSEGNSRVVVELQIESSYLAPSGVAIFEPVDGEPLDAQRIKQQTFNTTLACRSGGAMVAMIAASQTESESSTRLLYLAAEVLE